MQVYIVWLWYTIGDYYTIISRVYRRNLNIYISRRWVSFTTIFPRYWWLTHLYVLKLTYVCVSGPDICCPKKLRSTNILKIFHFVLVQSLLLKSMHNINEPCIDLGNYYYASPHVTLGHWGPLIHVAKEWPELLNKVTNPFKVLEIPQRSPTYKWRGEREYSKARPFCEGEVLR